VVGGRTQYDWEVGDLIISNIKTFLKKSKYLAKVNMASPRIGPSKEKMFAIRPGYRHRLDNEFFDDAASEEGWQREVYEAAAAEARKTNAKTVYDIGCGSGFKLMKHFAHCRTVGFDVGPSVTFLKEKYPEREWRESRFSDTIADPADIVICADVIEHIPDPDQLMDFLSRIKLSTLFLSTPERQLIYGFDHSGPPDNKAHCREWTMDELKQYVGRWFEVVHHVISNREQATQLLVCRSRASR
jgi:SAM-dependent methyltransferase